MDGIPSEHNRSTHPSDARNLARHVPRAAADPRLRITVFVAASFTRATGPVRS
jgi:hypothetical protein